MRVMVFVKATQDSEAGTLPASEMLEAMGRFNEELVNAGVMLAADGLKPSSEGKRVAFDGPGRTLIDGPFAEARELVAGYWFWEVEDMDEAVAWVRRCWVQARSRSGRSMRWPTSPRRSHPRCPNCTNGRARSSAVRSGSTATGLPDAVEPGDKEV